MNGKIQMRTMAGVCIIVMFLLACGRIAPGTTGTDMPAFPPTLITVTPMSTDGIHLSKVPDGAVPSPLPTSTPIPSSTPVQRYGFIQFQYVSKLSHKACTTNIPFLTREENGQTILSGGGDVNCAASAGNASAEIHGSLDLKGTVSPSQDYPEGHLVVHLKGLWTEEIEVEDGQFPLVFVANVDIPVDFNYLDGTKGFTDVPFNAEDYAFVLFLGHLTSETE